MPLFGSDPESLRSSAPYCRRDIRSLINRLLMAALMTIAAFAALSATATAAGADTLTTSISNSTPARDNPVQFTFTYTAGEIDNDGDGPYLYAVVRPSAGVPCATTYGADQSLGGNSDTIYKGTEIDPGTSSLSVSFRSPYVGSDVLCAWLEDDRYDQAKEGDTSDDVTGQAADLDFTTENTDQIGLALSTATPTPASDVTVTFSGSSTPIDQNGDGVYLYSLVRPYNNVPCATTYGGDEDADGSSASLIDDGVQLTPGNFTASGAFATGPAGSYIACAWLEDDDNDHAGRGDTSADVTAVASMTFAVAVPAPTPVVTPGPTPVAKPALRPELDSARLAETMTRRPKLTFTAGSGAGDLSSVKLRLPNGLGFSHNLRTLVAHISVRQGSNRLRVTISQSGRTLTIELRGRATKIEVTVGDSAITETASLRAKIRARKIHRLDVTFGLTNTDRESLSTTARLVV